MIILVLNCGSSSLKYQLLDMKNDEVYDLLAKGLVERIGMETGCLKHQATGKEKVVKIVFEGNTQVWDLKNPDNSMEIHTYKKIGTAIMTYHNWGIYQNTGIAQTYIDA